MEFFKKLNKYLMTEGAKYDDDILTQQTFKVYKTNNEYQYSGINQIESKSSKVTLRI